MGIFLNSTNTTHMALSIELMEKLIVKAGVKYTWMEFDEFMTEIKAGLRPLREEEEGHIFHLIQPQPPE